jgi:hypothetical protein
MLDAVLGGVTISVGTELAGAVAVTGEGGVSAATAAAVQSSFRSALR